MDWNIEDFVAKWGDQQRSKRQPTRRGQSHHTVCVCNMNFMTESSQ